MGRYKSNKTRAICIKVPPETYDQARRIAERLGMTISTAIEVFLIQVIQTESIPFSLKLGDKKEDSL